MQTWWRAVAKYPATWLAIVAVLVVEWFFFSLFDPPALFAVVALVFGAIAIVTWPLAMSVTGTLARLQFEVPKLEEVDPEEFARLTADLAGLEDDRASNQLDALLEKRASLVGVLERRLDAGELTFARYMTTAQQVYIAALENLHEVAVASHSISAIDEDYIARRLAELEEAEGGSAESERESLQSRRELRASQERKVAELLAQNEAAMTAIDRTATSLADAPIGRTPEDAQAAMSALEELAARASKYATG